MKKLLAIAAIFLVSMTAHAQNSRWDYIATTTTGTGQYIPLLVIPGTPVSLYTGCTSLPCLTKAVTYTSATGIACGSTAQIVLQLTNTCVATADSQGNFGFWVASGTYQYTETVAHVVYGPYNFTVGSGGGGSGTVNSGTAFGLAYYPATSNAVSGDTPFNGIPFVSTTTAPVAATSANIASILQVSTGCNSAGYVYLPQSNTCVPVSGVTNLTATAPLTVSAATGSVNISAAKTGTDAKLVTAATAGADGNCVQWSSTGGVADSGNPCSGAGGTGTVTTVSVGSLPPMFSTTVNTPATTPAISFSLSAAAAYTVWGNCTGILTTPSYCPIVTQMLPFTYTGNTTLLPTASSAFIAGDGLTTDANHNLVDTGSPVSSPSQNEITCASSIVLSATVSVNRLLLSCNVSTITIANGTAGACTTVQVTQVGGFGFTGWPSTVRGFFTPSMVANSGNSERFCWSTADSIWWASGTALTNQ